MMNKWIMIFGFLLFTLISSGCDTQKVSEENKTLKEENARLKVMMERMRASDDKLMFLAAKMDGVKARIKTNYGDIEMKFFPGKAPIQCFNFITRAESGFYDGTLFHRVIRGFMIQGGDPLTRGDDPSKYGTGGPLVNVPNEFNDIDHKRGIVSTARTANPNAGAGSQFFIMHADNPGLNGQYTAFGQVTKGMEVVDKIASLETNKRDRPLKPVRILTIEVYR